MFKKACLTWLVVYAVLAIAIGFLVYRRFPIPPMAIGVGVGGAIPAWIGCAYLVGIRRKIREMLMIRRAMSGEPPVDGARNAAIGRISPIGSPLISPLTRTPCIAYKYEIRDLRRRDLLVFDGFALTPSMIHMSQGSARLLAFPALNVDARYLKPRGQELKNAEEYIRTTEFTERATTDFTKSLTAMLKPYSDDHGSIRIDWRAPGDAVHLERTRFIEWTLPPGEQVCVIGHYSAQRGGFIPDPAAPLDQVAIEKGEPTGFGKLGSAIGSLIAGVALLGIVAAGLILLYANVPLAATEQISPDFIPSWTEIRLERELDRRARIPLRERRLLLDEGTISVLLPAGEASGRLRIDGQNLMLRKAEATREEGRTTVRIDGEVVVLTIDEKNHPLALKLGNRQISQAELAQSLDLEITDNGDEVAGRFTFLQDGEGTPACRATFRAKCESVPHR
jgi:hypothetical protein